MFDKLTVCVCEDVLCVVLSPVVWCSCGCNAAPVHLWWACGAVLSPFLREAAQRVNNSVRMTLSGVIQAVKNLPLVVVNAL